MCLSCAYTFEEERPFESNGAPTCPQCGGDIVEPPAGGIIGGLAGASLIGCWVVILAIGAVILAVLFWPAALVYVIIGILIIPLLPAVGAYMGMTYECKSCKFRWSFKEVLEYQVVQKKEGEEEA